MRKRCAIILVSILAIAPIGDAMAAPIKETFGNSGSCALQTSGATMTYNGSALTTSGGVFIGSGFQSQYGMVGCHITFDFSATQATVFTFPNTSYPSSFTFTQGALDWPVNLTVTYTDNSTSAWTITDDKTVGNTKIDTFTASAGKIIKSFTINAIQTTYDYWFLDGITWSQSAVATTTNVTDQGNKRATYGLVDQLSATVSGGTGKVTFFAAGKRIPKCINLTLVSLSAICQWRPATHGSTSVYAIFTSSDSAYINSQSIPINIAIAPRMTNR
jgi:hypothetical protein